MSAVKFQTMPPLSPEEYQHLEASCLEHGIQVPILVDAAGAVIDGHHRQKIAQEHGLYLPTETRDTLTDAEKTTLSISLNIDRRQLSRDQRREIIAASLRADPNLSDRGHAARTGSTHPTVALVRRELEQVESFTTSPDAEVVPDLPVNPQTGEVYEAGDAVHGSPEAPVTVTETHSVKIVTGLDGKEYKTTPKEPRRTSILDDARNAGWQLRKAVERLERIRTDDRYQKNKAEILAALQPHLDFANEIFTDL